LLTITDMRILPGDSAFLVEDGNTAILYDSGFAFTGEQLAQKLRRHLGGRKLDWIFLTHSHYDHALGSVFVRRAFPEAKVAASAYAAKIFQKPSARALMRQLDQAFALENGVTEYEDLADDLHVDVPLQDGDVIEAGSLRFQAVALPGHTLCSMGFYEESRRLLLACETSGVYDGEGVIVPCFLKGYQMALDSMRRMENMRIERLLLPHLGLRDGAEASFYLQNMYAAAENAAHDMACILQNGGSIEDAMEDFCQKYHRGRTRSAYPPAAIRLNSRIMAQVIQKELVV